MTHAVAILGGRGRETRPVTRMTVLAASWRWCRFRDFSLDRPPLIWSLSGLEHVARRCEVCAMHGVMLRRLTQVPPQAIRPVY